MSDGAKVELCCYLDGLFLGILLLLGFTFFNIPNFLNLELNNELHHCLLGAT